MKESSIVKKIRDYAEANGAVVVKYTGGPYAERGVSDLLMVWSGIFIACETKVPGKKPTPAQLLFLKRVADAGGLAFWCDSFEKFKEAVAPLVDK